MSLRQTLSRWGITVGLIITATLSAAEPGEAEAIFAKLAKLGAPDVRQAVYAKAPQWVNARGQNFASEWLSYDWEGSGNAWLLAETKNAAGQPVKATLVINGAEIAELSSAADEPVCGRLCGEWKPANLNRDTRKVLRNLESGEKGMRRLEDDSRLVLFAQQLYQRGDQENAVKILEAILSVHANERDAVIANAMTQLAEAQYNTLYRQFRISHDWKAYRDGIQALLARYPADWQMRPPIQRLLEQVEQRLAGAVPLPPPVENMGETDKVLAAKLLGIRSVRIQKRYANSSFPWLVPAAWPKEMQTSNDVDLVIRARGIAALPLLLALIKDPGLTEADGAELQGRSFYPIIRNSGNRPVDEVYASMNRPATRGEVAMAILKASLPDSITKKERFYEYQGDELLARCAAYHAKMKDAAPAEIAISYLNNDDGNTNSADVTSRARLITMSPKEVASLILCRAAVGDPGTQMRLAERLSSFVAEQRLNGRIGKSGFADIAATDFAEEWKTLVADKRVKKAAGTEPDQQTPSVDNQANDQIADIFLCLNEELFGARPKNWKGKTGRSHWLYNGQKPEDAGEYAHALIDQYGNVGRDLVRRRVLARLAGTPESALPPFPHDAPPSEKELAAVKARLDAATTGEQATTIINGLSIYARVALPGQLQNDPIFRRKLTTLANRITRISVNDDALKEKLVAWQGQAATPELVRQLRDHCEQSAKAGRSVSCQWKRSENLGGSEIVVATVPLMGAKIAGFDGLVAARDLYGAAAWRTAGPPKNANRWAFLSSASDVQEKLEAAIASLCDGNADMCSAALILFVTHGENANQ